MPVPAIEVPAIDGVTGEVDDRGRLRLVREHVPGRLIDGTRRLDVLASLDIGILNLDHRSRFGLGEAGTDLVEVGDQHRPLGLDRPPQAERQLLGRRGRPQRASLGDLRRPLVVQVVVDDDRDGVGTEGPLDLGAGPVHRLAHVERLGQRPGHLVQQVEQVVGLRQQVDPPGQVLPLLLGLEQAVVEDAGEHHRQHQQQPQGQRLVGAVGEPLGQNG